MDTCNILGLDIAVTNMEEVIQYLLDNRNMLSGQYVCVSNVHTTVMSYDSLEYKKVQQEAILRIPDGKPLSVISRKRGYKDAKRVTGPDLMLQMCKISGLRHYFYGSTQETLDKLCVALRKLNPDIQVAGYYSPPFRELTKEEDQAIVSKINSTSPDFVWVGLGAPKQEIWMYEHKNVIHGMMLGVGAAFDYHSGNIKRAPKWMQKCCLEWLFRLLQDPKRLFKRYLKTNIRFIRLIRKE